MKKLWLLTALVAMFLGFTACGEEDGPNPNKVYDFAPIVVHFTLTGENGEDLLDPATPGTYAGMPLTVTYRGNTYKKDVFTGWNRPYTRAYLADMNGIYTTGMKYVDRSDRYALAFGELDGADTYEDETITLNWGDGTTDVVTFSLKLKWKKDEPVIKRSFKLNGEEVAKDKPRPVIDLRRKPLDKLEEGMVNPLVFNFFLTNWNGDDLLRPYNNADVERSRVKAIFRGQEYYINQKSSAAEDDALASNFMGLTIDDSKEAQRRELLFGEFSGTETFEDETIVFDWGKLGCDTVTFTAKVAWKGNLPYFVRRYRLNGKEVSANAFSPDIWIKK